MTSHKDLVFQHISKNIVEPEKLTWIHISDIRHGVEHTLVCQKTGIVNSISDEEYAELKSKLESYEFKQCKGCFPNGEENMKEVFDKDYYENGVSKGISGYTNYHYRPEYVFPVAQKIKNHFGPFTVLDYGAAKGYLVKALRLLDVNAYGYDISKYAVENADPLIKEYMSNDMSSFEDKYFDLTVAKDTLEHVPKDKLQEVLASIKRVTNQYILVIVPLGDNGLFRIREFELDKTHVIKEDEEFWITEFKKQGFNILEFHYEWGNSKDHWLKVNPYGNGIFILEVKD